jgi:predicted negative regulator of RcsB-dependent stress response
VAIHDTEEEQVEQLKRWWAGNGSSLIGGVIGAVVIVSAWNYWHNHQQQQRAQAAQLYAQLEDSAAKGDHANVDKLADQLTGEYGGQSYAQFAKLEKAKNKIQTHDLDGAKAILQQQLQSGGDEQIRNISRIRLLQIMIAKGEYEPALKILSELDAKQRKAYEPIYDELEGDVFTALDRLDEARGAYQRAVHSGQASPLAQYKLDDLAVQDINRHSVDLK